MIHISPPEDATDEEVAAVLAAVHSFLARESSGAEPVSQRSAWREAGRLLVQDITPARLPSPSWGNIERLRRLRGRSYRT